jgi:hypothetical protein
MAMMSLIIPTAIARIIPMTIALIIVFKVKDSQKLFQKTAQENFKISPPYNV